MPTTPEPYDTIINDIEFLHDILSNPKHPYFKYLMRHVKILHGLRNSKSFQGLDLRQQLMQIWCVDFDGALCNGRLINLVNFILVNSMNAFEPFANDRSNVRNLLLTEFTILEILPKVFESFYSDMVLLLNNLDNGISIRNSKFA